MDHLLTDWAEWGLEALPDSLTNGKCLSLYLAPPSGAISSRRGTCVTMKPGTVLQNLHYCRKLSILLLFFWDTFWGQNTLDKRAQGYLDLVLWCFVSVLTALNESPSSHRMWHRSPLPILLYYLSAPSKCSNARAVASFYKSNNPANNNLTRWHIWLLCGTRDCELTLMGFTGWISLSVFSSH